MRAPKPRVACASMYVGVTTFAWARQLGPPWRYMPTSGSSLLLLLTKKRLCPELLDRSASMRAADAAVGIASNHKTSLLLFTRMCQRDEKGTCRDLARPVHQLEVYFRTSRTSTATEA